MHYAQGVPPRIPQDVIRVFRDSDASMAQVAKDYGSLAVVPEAVAGYRRAELVKVIEWCGTEMRRWGHDVAARGV